MINTPQVSVVMSVYNGAADLVETLDSVLSQQGCEFEFIVVNDGSVDATASILNRYAAADPRLRVLHQDNTGLTRALARGCAEANGEYIARQDAGDRSLPDRLASQRAFLDGNPEAVMVACAVQFSGPEHEPLYRASRPMMELDQGLRQLAIESLSGPPHHGATMFRRDTYATVGGYRLPFVVAQDIDLWLRMVERGRCLGMSELLYEARMAPGSISSRRRDEQFLLGSLAIACAKQRQGGSDEAVLLEAHTPARPPHGPAGRSEVARFHYYIASCLRDYDRAGARRYYRLALRNNPFHLKALWRCIAG